MSFGLSLGQVINISLMSFLFCECVGMCVYCFDFFFPSFFDSVFLYPMEVEQLELWGGGEEDVGSYLKYLHFYSPKFLLA